MKRLHFVFFDAGGGHRSAATALKSVIDAQNRGWQVDLVNLQEVLEPLDIFRKYAGIRMEDVYNTLLKRGWTLGSEYLVPLMHGIIRIYHPAQRRTLAQYWRERRPDLVVSVIPNFNRALFQGLAQVDPSIPLVTVITDIADYPPHFWMERQDQYMVCGSGKAVEQARATGYRPERILQTSGMILRPEFYREFTHDRAAERRSLGLDPDLPTGIVLFGGQGSPVMAKILQKLDRISSRLQLILICGRNEKLAARLRALPSRMPKHVVGFTREVPYFMSLADFFVGKPGPGSISEAIAMRLPVVVERNAWTLPQERYNCDWVLEKGVGVVLPSFRRIGDAVDQLLAPPALEAYRARVSAIENRAVFEIPEILDGILKAGERIER
jgi:UDP-N-acetylglucosamine:LPS N-acetylglucosamine transferase